MSSRCRSPFFREISERIQVTPSVVLFGGHVIYTIEEKQWIRIPLTYYKDILHSATTPGECLQRCRWYVVKCFWGGCAAMIGSGPELCCGDMSRHRRTMISWSTDIILIVALCATASHLRCGKAATCSPQQRSCDSAKAATGPLPICGRATRWYQFSKRYNVFDL